MNNYIEDNKKQGRKRFIGTLLVVLLTITCTLAGERIVKSIAANRAEMNKKVYDVRVTKFDENYTHEIWSTYEVEGQSKREVKETIMDMLCEDKNDYPDYGTYKVEIKKKDK